jgi:hypothetical protein
MRADAPLLVTEALLGGAIDGRLPDQPPIALDEKAWLETIRLASAHLVLPALATGLDAAGPAWTIDAEARAYLEAMRDGNAMRNRMLRQALAGIAGQLQRAGIDPIVVKGGAWLVEAPNASPWRFMGDLDLVVGEAELGPAQAILSAAGFAPAGGDYDPDRDAHAPAMLAPDGQTVVELHSRVFAEGAWPALETALGQRSIRIEAEGCLVRIPAVEVRAAHLVLHSQLHHAYHAQGRLLLRDLLELRRLASRSAGCDFAAALRLVPAGAQEAAMALLAAAERFGVAIPGIILEPSQRAWAEQARRRLMHRVFHRQLTGALSFVGHEMKRLVRDRQRTLRLAKSAARPAEISLKLRKTLTKIRNRSAG